MTAYVYIQTEKKGALIAPDIDKNTRLEFNLFTVGFYDPTGKWQPDSDYNEREDAAHRVHYLNGGHSNPLTVEEVEKWIDSIKGDDDYEVICARIGIAFDR